MTEDEIKKTRNQITLKMVEEWIAAVKELKPDPRKTSLKKAEAVQKAMKVIADAQSRGVDLESIASAATFPLSPGSLKSMLSAIRKSQREDDKAKDKTPPPPAGDSGSGSGPAPDAAATPSANVKKSPEQVKPEVNTKPERPVDLGSEPKPGGHPFVKNRGDID